MKEQITKAEFEDCINTIKEELSQNYNYLTAKEFKERINKIVERKTSG